MQKQKQLFLVALSSALNRKMITKKCKKKYFFFFNQHGRQRQQARWKMSIKCVEKGQGLAGPVVPQQQQHLPQ